MFKILLCVCVRPNPSEENCSYFKGRRRRNFTQRTKAVVEFEVLTAVDMKGIVFLDSARVFR
jgi:hypothetical protein